MFTMCSPDLNSASFFRSTSFFLFCVGTELIVIVIQRRNRAHICVQFVLSFEFFLFQLQRARLECAEESLFGLEKAKRNQVCQHGDFQWFACSLG